MRSFFDVSIVDRVAALLHVGCVASWIVGAVREPPLRGVSVKTKIPYWSILVVLRHGS
jgi:hypothetical protein